MQNWPNWFYRFRGWSRALIWVSVELCQVEGQPEVPPWLAMRGNIFKIVGNSGQLVPTFLSKHWWKHKQIRVLWQIFCSIYCVNMFWFNIQLAKKSYRRQFFIFIKKVSLKPCLSLTWKNPKPCLSSTWKSWGDNYLGINALI